jgi:hypothetical protein
VALKALAQRLTTDFPDEFLSLFRQVVEPGTPGECWEWPYALRLKYGHFYALGCTAAAHRTSFAAHKEDPPGDLVVRHKCDNPPCWNPEHLLLGTHADNMADAYARGRNARGDGHGMAVLNTQLVRGIAEEYLAGSTHRALAAKYEVSHAAVSAVVRRTSWREATEGLGLEENYRGYEDRHTTACATCGVSKVEHPERFKVIGVYRTGEIRLCNECKKCRNALVKRSRDARLATETRPCSTDGCERTWFMKGLCRKHYEEQGSWNVRRR